MSRRLQNAGPWKRKRSHASVDPAFWPIGLANIRTLAVGVPSGTWMNDHSEERSIPLFAHLLRLPRIESIFFEKLCTSREQLQLDYNERGELEFDENRIPYGYEVLPKGSSSIKHIFLHDCSGIDEYAQFEIWNAPRELRTVSFRHNGSSELDDTTGISNELTKAQRTCLKSLMWYDYDFQSLKGDHCRVFDNEEFDHFKTNAAIAQMSVSLEDIEHALRQARTYKDHYAPRWAYNDNEDSKGNIYEEDDPEEFLIRRFVTMFPKTLETLVIWGTAWPQEIDPAFLEEAIIRMIQDGRYQSLKAIFLENAEIEMRGLQNDNVLFQDAVAAGRIAGVDVHTSGNSGPMQHSTIFVEAPDQFDLVTGIFAGKRPADWKFDTYRGRRIAPSP